MEEKVSIGLDVGYRHINMVKLAGTAQGFKLLDLASVSLDPHQGQEEKLGQLNKMVQAKELASLPVNIGVCGESVIVRYIDLPKMKEVEVTQALKFEAQQYIPFKMEEVTFDFYILGPASSDQNKMKVLLVAAKKEAIMEYIKFMQQAGLKPHLIDVKAFSLINCFQVNGPQVKEDDVFALLNLEFDLANINILRGKMPFFSRDISLLEDTLALPKEKDKDLGFFETIKPLLANLIREIRLSIDYFESEFEKQVKIIYLSGEGAHVQELINFFGSELGREISLWNPLQNLAIDAAQINTDVLKEKSCLLAIACGLALRG